MNPHPQAVGSGWTGTCLALFVYDVGLSINLDQAERKITAFTRRAPMQPKRRAPQYLDYQPAPLRVSQDARGQRMGDIRDVETVDLALYDFGAISVCYTIPVDATPPAMLALSLDLYDNATLLTDSRRRVEVLLEEIREAIDKPNVASFVEDYMIFRLIPQAGLQAKDWLGWSRDEELAQILRSEQAALSREEIEDATACRISFGTEDLTLIDWNAALVIGREMGDILAVLEFANVELLEVRYLDRQLDAALDQAYDALAKRRWRRLRWPGTFESDLRRVAQLQVDSAILFERVTNALKLLGDQFLDRAYRLTSQRFRAAAWDASIIRKLQTLDSIYGKMADLTATRRMEALEWIIIILIAVSILLPFTPWAH